MKKNGPTSVMDFKDELKETYVCAKSRIREEKNRLVEAACIKMETEFKTKLQAAANDGKHSVEFKLKTNIEYAAIFELAKKYDLLMNNNNNHVINDEYYGRIIVSGWDK